MMRTHPPRPASATWPEPDPRGKMLARLAERRQHGRVELHEPALLHTSHAEMQGLILDLSSGGAAVRIVDGLQPGLGEEIAISTLDRRHFWGRVCWLGQSMLGIAFPHAVAGIEELAWLEHRDSVRYFGRPRGR